MSDVSNPAKFAVVVVPNDAVDLTSPCRSLYIGTSGDLVVIPYGQTTSVLFQNVPVGVFPVQASRVLATGTTATDIVALW